MNPIFFQLQRLTKTSKYQNLATSCLCNNNNQSLDSWNLGKTHDQAYRVSFEVHCFIMA